MDITRVEFEVRESDTVARLTAGQEHLMPPGPLLVNEIPLPPECDASSVVRDIILRHETFRTIFDGRMQRIVNKGHIPLYHASADEDVPIETATDCRLPYRVLIRHHKEGRMLEIAAPHCLLDGESAVILRQEVARPFLASRDRWQPREVAQWEIDQCSDVFERAVRYWGKIMTEGVFVDGSDDGVGERRHIPGIRTALRAASERLGIPRSAVLIGISCYIYSSITGVDRVTVKGPFGNRIFPMLKRYVGQLSQGFIAVCQVDSSLDRTCLSAANELLRGFKNAHFRIDDVRPLLPAGFRPDIYANIMFDGAPRVSMPQGHYDGDSHDSCIMDLGLVEDELSISISDSVSIPEWHSGLVQCTRDLLWVVARG